MSRLAVRLGLWTVAAVTTAACGGGGPGVQGAEAVALFTDYSGTWVLDTLASDASPRTGLERARSSGRGGGRGGDPFGGSGPPPGDGPFGGFGPPRGGGFGPPGGGFPGGGRGTGGSMDPARAEATRTLMELATSRPDRIVLELSDSSFVVRERPGASVDVPMKGDEVEILVRGSSVKAKVRWDGREPRLERSVDGGGTVVDRYELEAPNRLAVTRSFDLPRRGDVTVRFVYQRQELEPAA